MSNYLSGSQKSSTSTEEDLAIVHVKSLAEKLMSIEDNSLKTLLKCVLYSHVPCSFFPNEILEFFKLVPLPNQTSC